jgi:hypothetical protein
MFGQLLRIDERRRGSRGTSVVEGHFALRLPNLTFFARLSG